MKHFCMTNQSYNKQKEKNKNVRKK